MAKSKHQKQKVYKMKGCSKKTRKNKHLGGSSISESELSLAYPANNIHAVPNPYLAYTGRGGCGCGSMNGGGKKKGLMIKGNRHRLHCKSKKSVKNKVCNKKQTKKQRGGTLSNLLGQDLVNLGRQINFGVGSAYNTLTGYSSPVNPMPWKGQLHNGSNVNSLKAAYI